MIVHGRHAAQNEREQLGYRIFRPGMFTPGADTFHERSWHAQYSVLGIRIKGANGATIQAGRKANQPVPFDCSVIAVQLIGDRAGSITLDVERTTFGALPSRPADTLTPLAIGRPKLVNQQVNEDRALFGWTTALLKDDILLYRVLDATGINSITLSLLVARNDQP